MDSSEQLKNGVVLAELGGYGDGPYCARHGAGAALVLLGTYIVDPGEEVPYPPAFVFKPGRRNYGPYLQEHVAVARESGAQVGVSVVSIELDDSIDFLRAAEEAGADYVSYCAHSTMEMFTSRGLSSALCRREGWDRLREWARAIVGAVSVPVIFKVGLGDTPDTFGAVDVMIQAGVPMVHINVEDCQKGSPGLEAVGRLVHAVPFLIAGGGIRDLEGARALLSAGADAVAIGSAAMKDAGLCGRLQRGLRSIGT